MLLLEICSGCGKVPALKNIIFEGGDKTSGDSEKNLHRKD
jgi:hypothetical protein